MCREREIAKIAFAAVVTAIDELRNQNNWSDEDEKIVMGIEIPGSIIVGGHCYQFCELASNTASSSIACATPIPHCFPVGGR
jgi:hypothetical protein